MAKRTGKPTGRPPHEPTDENRRIVREWAEDGVQKQIIAARIGLGSTETLNKYYSDEFDMGRAEYFHFIASQGRKLVQDLNPSMIIFMHKAALGYHETQKIEHDGSVQLTAALPERVDETDWDKSARQRQKALQKAGLKVVE